MVVRDGCCAMCEVAVNSRTRARHYTNSSRTHLFCRRANVVRHPSSSSPSLRSLATRSTASALSNLTRWWVGALFCLGHFRRLLHSDLNPPPHEAESGQLVARWHTAWQQQLSSSTRCPAFSHYGRTGGAVSLTL